MKVKLTHPSNLSNPEIYEMVSYFMDLTEDTEVAAFTFRGEDKDRTFTAENLFDLSPTDKIQEGHVSRSPRISVAL